MPTRPRLTNSSDETDLTSLLSGDNVFAIPYFQRPYKWMPERLRQLNRDLLNIVDGAVDYHFLGAVIVHGRRNNPSDPKVYEVIDGQQRLTTIFVYLCAIIRVLCKVGRYGDAAGLFLKFIGIGRPTTLISNVKIHPGKDDREQLNSIIRELLSDEKLVDALGQFTFKPLPSVGVDRGRLKNNYRAALKFFEEQRKAEGENRLDDLYTALLDFMTVVQIDVWDPTNGPKIFDSLNSQQEPMTTGDLVRNEIFARVASQQPAAIEDIDQRSWQPFYRKFQVGDRSLFDAFFFPFGLIQDPNLKKSEVFAKLREKWREIGDPEIIIKELALYQNAFLDLATGSNHQGLPANVARAFERLRGASTPISTYPFLIRVSNALRDGDVAPEDGIGALQVIESFLVRRAAAGHEPTGLHAVFKRLWSDTEGAVNVLSVTESIRRHRTVVWPSDDDFKEAIESRPMYGSSITPYLLIEWNRHLGGDQPSMSPWVEHVLPDHPDREWFDIFSRDEHEQVKDRLANLLPLSQEMNRELGNKSYPSKRQRYKDDSAFKAARKFAEEIEAWTPVALKERSKALSVWALTRWPY